MIGVECLGLEKSFGILGGGTKASFLAGVASWDSGGVNVQL